MKSIKEVRNWLLANRVNEYGDLNLIGLDFSEFNGDIYISNMNVKKDLYQCNQEVQGNLFQDSQIVQGSLDQSFQEVQGSLDQSFQEVQGDYDSKHNKAKGNIIEEPCEKWIEKKKMTKAQIEKELGYEIEIMEGEE